ncbi:MAG: NAD(P)-dependent alcohol dehydrogenase [Myxococcales bacterium]|nr:NAD(P)-dependent alcohol dehydrogenase [Myxococcales bacterium]
MRAFEIKGNFGLENLVAVERPKPEPGPQEILIKVNAVSLNYRDLLTIQGLYNPKQKLPLIPLSDGAGEVVGIGEQVDRVKVGDRVMPIFAQRWLSGEPTREKLKTTLGGPLDGVLAEYVVLHQDGVVHTPEHLSDIEAAALPCAAVTAWHALVGERPLLPGEVVLVQGTGGVSIFALQFAKILGARVIVTSSRDEKLEKVEAMGADALINYKRTPDWAKAARALTDGVGVDHVIEVGGAGTLNQSLRAVRMGGHISVIGVLAGVAQEVNVIPILMQNLRLQGVIVGHREHFESMNRMISLHRLRPSIDRVFPVDEVEEAFSWMAQGSHFGKICLTF